MGGLLVGFGHPHRILRRVEAIEGRGIRIELVAHYDDECAQSGHGRWIAMPDLRQASEQNFTSFQVRAQRLRQVIGRPQARQALLANDCLLPLNEAGVLGFIGAGVKEGA